MAAHVGLKVGLVIDFVDDISQTALASSCVLVGQRRDRETVT